MKVSDGLWLMNKAALLQLEHFNKSNALAWALTMGLFATPVVLLRPRVEPDCGRIVLHPTRPGDRFGWTEPEGKVYQIAADNLARLKDEIYRVCYLISQAGGATDAARPIGAEQAERLQHHARSAAGLRRCREGNA